MAPISYYYFFSIILAAGSLLWLINLVYLKRTGRTTFGQVYMVGTPEYKRVIKLASKQKVTITIIITLLFFVNLIWSILTVLQLNTSSAYLLLISAPVVVAGFFAAGAVMIRKGYGTNFSNGEEIGKDKDEPVQQKRTHKKSLD